MDVSGILPPYMQGRSPVVEEELSTQKWCHQGTGPRKGKRLRTRRTLLKRRLKETLLQRSPLQVLPEYQDPTSARMTVTSETVEVGEPSSSGEPVFKSCRQDIIKGKDIGNRAARRMAKEPTIQEQLGEVFKPKPNTFSTSIYNQFCKEQAKLRRDTHNPNFGRGVGGRLVLNGNRNRQ